MCLLFCYIVIVQITSHPASVLVNVNSTATLSCKATGSSPIIYQWRRVNGEINSDRADGVNTSTLTISSVQRYDEDEYYCVASNEEMDGSLYNDSSSRAIVTVYGKVIILSFHILSLAVLATLNFVKFARSSYIVASGIAKVGTGRAQTQSILFIT